MEMGLWDGRVGRSARDVARGSMVGGTDGRTVGPAVGGMARLAIQREVLDEDGGHVGGRADGQEDHGADVEGAGEVHGLAVKEGGEERRQDAVQEDAAARGTDGRTQSSDRIGSHRIAWVRRPAPLTRAIARVQMYDRV